MIIALWSLDHVFMDFISSYFVHSELWQVQFHVDRLYQDNGQGGLHKTDPSKTCGTGSIFSVFMFCLLSSVRTSNLNILV